MIKHLQEELTDMVGRGLWDKLLAEPCILTLLRNALWNCWLWEKLYSKLNHKVFLSPKWNVCFHCRNPLRLSFWLSLIICQQEPSIKLFVHYSIHNVGKTANMEDHIISWSSLYWIPLQCLPKQQFQFFPKPLWIIFLHIPQTVSN